MSQPPLEAARLALHPAVSGDLVGAVNDAPNVASERMLLALGFEPLSEVQGLKYRMRTMR